jgi:hypothetical protein
MGKKTRHYLTFLAVLFFLFSSINLIFFSQASEGAEPLWGDIMPVPVKKDFFPYDPVRVPVTNIDPSLAKPVGIGTIAIGGNIITISISLEGFLDPVDIFGAFILSTNPTSVYVLNPDDVSFTSVSTSVIQNALATGTVPQQIKPWREGVYGPINESLFEISLSESIPVIYSLYFLVSPAGSLNSYYVWSTSFNADIQPEYYSLFVNKDGSGNGTVSSSPSGITCGFDCSEQYIAGTEIQLSAAADSGSIFTGWSGGPCTGTGICQVTMDSDQSITANFIQEGAPGSINYTEINLAWDNNQYEGSLRDEFIGPDRTQKFYKFTRPAGCTNQMQVWLAGNITGEANVNMVVSDSDFNTTGEALSLYLQFLGDPPVYEQFNTVTIAGRTYWYWFSGSYESEFVYFFNPVAPEYYIQLVNEEAFTGIYRIEAFCS